MGDRPRELRLLAEKVLADAGSIPLATLLQALVPVGRLRSLARSLGLTPKGGFRVDKAPATVLAPLLAEQRDPDQLDQVLQLVLPSQPETATDAAPADAGTAAADAIDLTPVLALREAELSRLREELERAREAATRSRERETDLQRRLQAQEELAGLLRGEVDRLRRAPAEPGNTGRGEPDRELQQRVHDLELEREALLDADAALRRQLAFNQSRMRELEDDVAELEALLPKGRRRKRPAEPPPEPVDDKRFRLPYFLPSFHKSLIGKDRRSIARAFQAILLFCTEGHGYPGLEVKQMGGQDTWSLRASLGLRVYFRQRPDGDVEFLELADREEQHTTLRRLKER